MGFIRGSVQGRRSFTRVSVSVWYQRLLPTENRYGDGSVASILIQSCDLAALRGKLDRETDRVGSNSPIIVSSIGGREYACSKRLTVSCAKLCFTTTHGSGKCSVPEVEGLVVIRHDASVVTVHSSQQVQITIRTDRRVDASGGEIDSMCRLVTDLDWGCHGDEFCVWGGATD